MNFHPANHDKRESEITLLLSSGFQLIRTQYSSGEQNLAKTDKNTRMTQALP